MITIETIVNELDSLPEAFLVQVLSFIRSTKNKDSKDSDQYVENLSLDQRLGKDERDRTITQLLESFHTEEISLETINAEVETVRAELYARQKDS